MDYAQDNLWIEKQRKAFTLWVNSHLNKYKMPINDLYSDFIDGIKLHYLICHLSKTKLMRVKANPKHKMEMISNLSLSFNVLSSQNVKIVNISSEDIYDKNEKLILGLIWTLIQHYQLGMLRIQMDPSVKPANDAETLKFSIKYILKLPNEWNLDIGKELKEGKMLFSLVNSIGRDRPIDMKDLLPRTAEEYATKAVDTAEEYLNVPKMIEVDEMLHSKIDDKVLATYLSSILLAKPVKELPSLTEIVTKEAMMAYATVVGTATQMETVKQVKGVTQTESVKRVRGVKQVTAVKETAAVKEVDPRMLFYQSIMDRIGKCQYSTQIVDSSTATYITKRSSNNFLLDVNDIPLTLSSDLKLFLVKKGASDPLKDVYPLDMAFGRKKIAEAKLAGIQNGEYIGIIVKDGVPYSQLSKEIKVTDQHQFGIKTKIITKQCIETLPISILYDKSDFVGENIEVQIFGNLQDVVTFAYSSHLTYLTFIPSTRGYYEIKYYRNDQNIESSNVIIDVQQLTEDTPFRPLPIKSTPYLGNSYHALKEMTVLSENKSTEYQDKIKISSSDQINAELIYQDQSTCGCETSFNSPDRYFLQAIPQKSGLCILNAEIVSKSGTTKQLMCQPIIVEDNKLIVGEETVLLFQDNDNNIDIDQVDNVTTGKNIVQTTKLTKYAGQMMKELRFVPLSTGMIHVKVRDNEKRTIDLMEFRAEQVAKGCLEASCDDKFTKSFQLKNKHTDCSNIYVCLLDPSKKQTKCTIKIKEDQLLMKFVPSMSGIYVLIVKENGVDILGSPFEIHSKTESRKIPNTTYIQKYKVSEITSTNIAVQLMNNESTKLQTPPFKLYKDQNGEYILEIFLSFPEDGYYCLEVCSDGKPITLSPSVFLIKPDPERFCMINEYSKFVISPQDLTITQPPASFSCKYKIIDRDIKSDELMTFELEKTSNPSRMDLIFTPTQHGLIRVNPKHNGIPIFKNPLVFTVRDKPYEQRKIDPKDTQLGSTSQQIPLYLSDVSNFKFYNEHKVNGLLIEIIKGSSIVYSNAVFYDQNNNLVTLIPKNLKEGGYVMQLKNNNELIDGSITQMFSLGVDRDGEADDFKLFNSTKKNIQCKLVEKNKVVETISLRPGENKIQIRAKLTSAGPYEIITDDATPPKEIPMLIMLAEKKSDVIESSSKKFVFFDKQKPEIHQSYSKVEIVDSEQCVKEFTSVDSGVKYFECEIDPKMNAPYQLNIFDPKQQVKSLPVMFSPPIGMERHQQNPEFIIAEKQVYILLDLPWEFKMLSESKIAEIAVLVDLHNGKFDISSLETFEVIGDKIKIPYMQEAVGEHILFIANKNTELLFGSTSKIDVIGGDDTAVRITAVGNGLQKALMNHENCFKLRSKNIEIDDIKIISEPELTFIKSADAKNEVDVLYTPDFVGNLIITIMYKGVSISNSPYKIKVSNNEKGHTSQRILYLPQKEIGLSIRNDLQKYSGRLKYILTDSHKMEISNRVQFLSYDSSLKITDISLIFMVTHHGMYNLTIKDGNSIIENGEIRFYVSPWYPVRSKTIVVGSCLDMAIIGHQNSFSIFEPHDKGQQKYCINIIGSGECDYSMVKISSTQTIVNWTPHVEGEYIVNVTYENSKSVEGFPKKVQAKKLVEIEEKMKKGETYYIYGDGLSTAIMNYPNSFYISSHSRDTSGVQVKIEGKSTVVIHEENSKLGGINYKRITYSVPSKSVYKLNITVDGKHIGSSPYMVRAINRNQDIDMIKCSLAPNYTAKCKAVSEFFIDASRVDCSDIDICIHSSDYKSCVKTRNVELGNKMYSVQFQCDSKQFYIAKITSHGMHIKGSPFKFQAC